MESGKVPVSEKFRKLIFHIFHINPEWWETGEGEVCFKHPKPREVVPTEIINVEETQVPYKPTAGSVPFYRQKVQAGTDLEQINDIPEVPFAYAEIPGFNGTHKAVQIFSESMMPTYKPGNWIICRELLDKNVIIWGEVYMVVLTNGNAYLKRLYQGNIESELMLISDNESKRSGDYLKFPPTKISVNQLTKIYSVHGSINKEGI